ncbi:MAG: nucleotide exchange factor GrpE [Bacteroidales bacterium]
MKEQKRDKHDQTPDTEKPAKEQLNETITNKQQTEAVTEQPTEQPEEKAKEQSKEKSADEKIAELNDRYLRLAAEFDNFRRRSAKERLDLVMTASEETIKGILPVLDDFERALDVLHKTDGDHVVAIEGTELIYNKLFAYLETKGLKMIESIGKELNTDFHEAIAQIPAPDKANKKKIIDVVQQGYTLNGKVIRFAKVVVGI